MPTDQEVSEALEEIAEYADDLNHDIIARNQPGILISENNKLGEIELIGHQCEAENNVYFVGAHPEIEYAIVIYHMSILGSISNSLTVEESRNILESAGVNFEGESVEMRAAEYLINSVDNQNMQSFKSNFEAMVASPDYEYDINTNEKGNFESYSLDLKLFPYDDSFNIRNFYNSVRSVVEGGKRSAELLRMHMSISIDEENSAKSVVEFGPPSDQ